ncbi:MAG: hypothetical protein KatS3mg051_2132 [Anaerolineae bacterium]|nr:MAG: hypothetical protein KatS3mg051_2132 [Anaerolineae bacterium]
MNARLSERLAVVATIDPDAYGIGTQTTDIIDMKNRRRVLFVVMAGDLGTNGTLDFNVYGSAASDMSGAGLITGKSITQLTQAGTDSDKQVIVEVTAEEVAAQGYRYIRGNLVIGTATSDAAVLALAGDLAYSPASEYDLSSVDEIVA